MKIYAGLDGGSTYLKAALIDEHKRVLRTGVTNTGIDNNGAAKRLLAKLMNNSGRWRRATAARSLRSRTTT